MGWGPIYEELTLSIFKFSSWKGKYPQTKFISLEIHGQASAILQEDAILHLGHDILKYLMELEANKSQLTLPLCLTVCCAKYRCFETK